MLLVKLNFYIYLNGNFEEYFIELVSHYNLLLHSATKEFLLMCEKLCPYKFFGTTKKKMGQI